MEEIQMARPPLPPPAAVVAATAMPWVLGDDDLLHEILLRLVLPTSLLRAALVCKRWYRHASNPAFLRRFRDRHPPRVLGVYLNEFGGQLPLFVPILPVPELAAAARHAGSFFDSLVGSSAFVEDSRDDRLLVSIFNEDYEYGYDDRTLLLCSPLSSAGNALVLPPLRPAPPPIWLPSPDLRNFCIYLPEGGDGRSYLSVMMGFSHQQTTACLFELQDMSWVLRASAAAQLHSLQSLPKLGMLLDDSKLYILVTGNRILVCDFPSSSITAMELPNGVNADSYNTKLSRRDDSGVYLLHVKESLLHVFHSDDAGNWFLVRSICLHEVFTNLGVADCGLGSAPIVTIRAVGDNAMFVFFEMYGTIVFLDITSKQAEKVFVTTPEEVAVSDVHPLMLRWPPVFPELKE